MGVGVWGVVDGGLVSIFKVVLGVSGRGSFFCLCVTFFNFLFSGFF